jgi:RecJ-like exonuclease
VLLFLPFFSHFFRVLREQVRCYVLGTVAEVAASSPGKPKRSDSPDKSGAAKSGPVVELSLRKSHLHGVGAVNDVVVSSISDVKPDDVLRGYISNTTDNGVFVALSPTVTGRVQIANLSDLFIKDFRAAFPPGTRVRARVLSVDAKSGRVELTLKPSAVDPDKFKV